MDPLPKRKMVRLGYQTRQLTKQNNLEKSAMQVRKKIILFLLPSVLIFLPSGCQLPQKSVGVILLPDSAEGQGQPSDSVAKRFQESTTQGPTMVESAMDLSKKYARLSEEVATLRQKNHNFIAENRRLKDQLTTVEVQFQQTQKELTEANDLLIEMRIELNNWKANILGFRDEIRDAEKAQLEALLKVLKILGGEVKTESAQGQDTGSPAASPSKSGRSEP